MALTVDQLLHTDFSSDDETEAAPPSALPATSAPNPGGSEKKAIVEELTVEQALAQVDLSDDEYEDDCLAAAGPPTSENIDQDLQALVVGEDPVVEPEPANVNAEVMVCLDDLLAMDSDSSEDNFDGVPVLSSGAAPPEQKHSEAPCDEEGRGDVDTSVSEADTDAFLRNPFEWCLEHERSLLSVQSEESAQSPEQSDARLDCVTGGSCGIADLKPAFSAVETKPCAELRRILAQELGLPTCVVSNSNFVGVGTLRGAVVLLDPKVQDATSQPQVLSPPASDEAVAVTAAAFSPDGSSMLIGHKNGQLLLWDLAGRKVLYAVKDLHSGAVLSVVFCRPTGQYALSADSNGSVFFLSFTSSFGRWSCSHHLLLEQSSNIGITMRILPLAQNASQTNHPAYKHCLVTLCATDATVLLTLHPSVQLIHKMQYHSKNVSANTSWIPDAAWLRFDAREWSDTSDIQCNDPHLCVAFGQTIHVMRVSFDNEPGKKEEFTLRPAQRYTWGSPIQSVMAFNDSVLGILDNSDKLSIVQLPVLQEEDDSNILSQSQALIPIHAEDIGGWSVVYHTHTSLDGSKDARSHHGALAVFRGRGRNLYICGMKEVWHLQIARWGQHIEELVNRNHWSAALHIFVALYKGQLPPLMDFPHAVSARQRAVGSRTTQVIQSYLASRLQQDTPRAQARQMCFTLVSACVEMNLWSVLYKTVFECFKATGHMNVYCNTLEPFMVKGRIPRSQMDSEVLSSILQSYALPLEEEEQLAARNFNVGAGASEVPKFLDCDHFASLFPVARRLQQLVLYVDVSQLDLNLALRLFTQYRLWTALVHVYCALRDYASPLELLVGECAQLAKKCSGGLEDSSLEGEAPLLRCCLVRKLFYFLHRCFELRPFPLDSKDGPGMVHPGPNSILELLQCIFMPDTSSPAGERPKPPPMFVRLLRLSPFGLFSVLSVLYVSPSAGRAIQSHGAGDGPCVLGAAYHPLSLGTLFLATEAAMEAAMSDEGTPLPKHSDSEFLRFAARAAPRIKQVMRPELFGKIVEYLLNTRCLPSTAGAGTVVPSQGIPCQTPRALGRLSSEVAQQLLIGVLATQESLGEESRNAFICKATQQSFFGVASWLHEEHGEYDRALDCQMRDDELRDCIFEYIISRLAEKSEDKCGLAALVEATLQRLPRLVAIDAERCAAMVCEQFATIADHDSVLERLRGYPQIELQYLETLLMRHRRSHWKTSEEQQIFFDSHVVRYVELLCSLTPDEVMPFLAANETLPLRECLELCRKHCVIDASVYLLERTGDFSGVLGLLLTDYNEALDQLHKSFTEPREQIRTMMSRVVKRLVSSAQTQGVSCNDTSLELPWWEGFQDAQRCIDLLTQTYELSSRNSNLMTAAQLEELWFGVLGGTVRWQERMNVSKDTSKRQAAFSVALAELSSRAMAGVLAYLSLPRSLKRICSEFGSSALGVWKDPLQSMMSGLNFQQGLLDAAKAVAAQDVVKPFTSVKKRGSRGVLVRTDETSMQLNGPIKVRLTADGPGAVESK